MVAEPALLDLTGSPRPWPARLRALWARCLTAATIDSSLARTPPWRGESSLSRMLAAELSCTEPVHVTAGVRAIVPAFAALGRRVTVETPTFEGIAAIFALCGVRVGLASPESFLAEVRDPGAELLWLTSPSRNPDGWSLSADLAASLGEFVAAGGVVVHNEVYHWFGPPGVRVPGAYRVGSLSKLAGGWARTGWLVGNPLGPLAAHLHSGTPPTPWQAAWARFADEGGFAELVARARWIGQHTTAAAALFADGPGPAPTGASLLLDVPGPEPVRRLQDEAGVLVGPGPAFAASESQVRLCFLGCDDTCDHTAALRRVMDLGAVLCRPGRGKPAG